MKTPFALISAVIVFSLFSCKKLDEPVEAYFFVNNSGSETYTLFINKEAVGVIPEIDTIAIPCEPSTLVGTKSHDLKLKRNKFELKDSSGKVVSEGKFKIGQNESLSYSISSTKGHTFASLKEGVFVMGFLTDFVINEKHPINACDY